MITGLGDGPGGIGIDEYRQRYHQGRSDDCSSESASVETGGSTRGSEREDDLDVDEGTPLHEPAGRVGEVDEEGTPLAFTGDSRAPRLPIASSFQAPLPALPGDGHRGYEGREERERDS